MKRQAFILIIITFLSKVFGFGRYVVLANFYGASEISDAYLISLTIPLTIFQFLGESISTTFIPLYNEIVRSKNKTTAYIYISNLVTILSLISIFLIGIAIIMAPIVVRIFAAGFQGETLELAVGLTRISVVGILFSVLMSIFRGYLYAHENYYVPRLVGIPFNLIVIASIFISSSYGNVGILAYGTLFAIFSELIIIFWAALKAGFRFKLCFNYRDPFLHRMIKLATPTMFGTSMNQINKVVDRRIASSIAIGGISALNYANRLNLFIQQTLVSSISTVLYPITSKMAADGNIDGLKESLREAVNITVILVVPASIGTVVFSDLIVELLFMRGAFDATALAMCSTALIYYSIGMVGFGLRDIITRAFYSIQDTNTPMLNSGIGMAMNIILNFVLSQYLGIGGLALATSIAANFTTILLFVNLHRKIGSIGIRRMLHVFVKVLFSSVVMGLASKTIFEVLIKGVERHVALFLCISCGILIYFFVISLMKIDDVDAITFRLKYWLTKRI